MGSPNNAEDNAPTRHISILNETSSARNGLRIFDEGASWKLLNISGYIWFTLYKLI